MSILLNMAASEPFTKLNLKVQLHGVYVRGDLARLEYHGCPQSNGSDRTCENFHWENYGISLAQQLDILR
jgi:hypothetical protein